MAITCLPIPIIGEICYHLDSLTTLRLLKTIKSFYANWGNYESLKTELVNCTYFRKKRHYRSGARLMTENYFPSYLVQKINKCKVGFCDYWDALHMFTQLEEYISRMEYWDNKYFKNDLSKLRSLIQGVRVALHIRGIEIPESPVYDELPQDLRSNCGYYKGISLEVYYEHPVIKGRKRHLLNKYKKIDLDSIRANYSYLFKQ